MDDEASQRGAALPGCAHRGEGDAAQGKVQVGARCDDGGVVAAEFEDGSPEACCHSRPHGTAHGRRTRGGE